MMIHKNLSLCVLAFLVSSNASTGAYVRSITLDYAGTTNQEFINFSPEAIDLSSVANDEVKTILNHPEFKQRVGEAFRELRGSWEEKAVEHGFYERGMSLSSVRDFARITIIPGPIGFTVEARIPLEFDLNAFPLTMTLVSGVTMNYDLTKSVEVEVETKKWDN